VIKTNAELRSKISSAEAMISKISGLIFLREGPEKRTTDKPLVVRVSATRIEPPAIAAAIGNEKARVAADLDWFVNPYQVKDSHFFELLI